MPAPRKYDQETRDRAVRMFQDRRRDRPAESALQARLRVGELLDVNHQTLRGWVERVEIDAGERPGIPTATEARIRELGAPLSHSQPVAPVPLLAVDENRGRPPARRHRPDVVCTAALTGVVLE